MEHHALRFKVNIICFTGFQNHGDGRRRRRRRRRRSRLNFSLSRPRTAVVKIFDLFIDRKSTEAETELNELLLSNSPQTGRWLSGLTGVLQLYYITVLYNYIYDMTVTCDKFTLGSF